MRSPIRSPFAGPIVIALLVCLPAFRAGAQEVPPKHDSLKILERFAGAWEQQITLKPGPWAPEGKTGTGTMTGKWTLDGRFMEMRTESKVDGSKGLSVMGYDITVDALRGWSFHSHGYTFVSTATWDETTKTLSWTADMGNGMKATSFDKFTDDDHFEWQFQIKDDQGEVMFEMTGKAARRKQK